VTPEEIAIVARWMAEGLDDLYIGAQWQDRAARAGRPQMKESWTVTGKRLREEVVKQQEERG
jgi:hypothetical protein